MFSSFRHDQIQCDGGPSFARGRQRANTTTMSERTSKLFERMALVYDDPGRTSELRFREDPVGFLQGHKAEIAPEREVDVLFQIRATYSGWSGRRVLPVMSSSKVVAFCVS